MYNLFLWIMEGEGRGKGVVCFSIVFVEKKSVSWDDKFSTVSYISIKNAGGDVRPHDIPLPWSDPEWT